MQHSVRSNTDRAMFCEARPYLAPCAPCIFLGLGKQRERESPGVAHLLSGGLCNKRLARACTPDAHGLGGVTPPPKTPCNEATATLRANTAATKQRNLRCRQASTDDVADRKPLRDLPPLGGQPAQPCHPDEYGRIARGDAPALPCRCTVPRAAPEWRSRLRARKPRISDPTHEIVGFARGFASKSDRGAACFISKIRNPPLGRMMWAKPDPNRTI